MNKYAKTKDGKIVKVNLEGDVFTSRYEIIGEPKDTIEELCDGYVVEYTGDSNSKLKGFWYMQYIEALKRLKKDKRRLFELLEVSTLKLFIKTDKGLIYVAKMNEEGELELI